MKLCSFPLVFTRFCGLSSPSQSTSSYTSCRGFLLQEFSLVTIALFSVRASIFIVCGVKLTGYALLDPPVNILCIIWLVCNKDQSNLWRRAFLVHIVLCLRWSFASAVVPHPVVPHPVLPHPVLPHPVLPHSLLCLCLYQLGLLVIPHLISHCSRTFQGRTLRFRNA